jgi:hypothetical protein
MNATSDANASTTVKGTVARGRLPNTHYRTREYRYTQAIWFAGE